MLQYPLFLSGMSETWILSTELQTILIFLNWQVDGQTHTYVVVISRFSEFYERA